MNSNGEIVALDDFEHVLLRPTMYVGSVDKSEEKIPIIRNNKVIVESRDISVGFYKMMIEILDNAFDEAKRLKGQMPKIEIHFDSKTNGVTVVDTGGGFLNGSAVNKKTGDTNVASAVTRLRAGTNFTNDNKEENLIGTNGVGAALVNMLSDEFSITTINSKESYTQEWTQFVSKGPKVEKKKSGVQTGTTVFFQPRKDMFKRCKWDKEYVHSMMIFKQFLKKNDPIISDLEFICTFDGEQLDLDVSFVPENNFKIETTIGVLYVWESFPQSSTISFINGAICTGIHQLITREWLNDAFDSPVAHKFYECFFMLNLPPKIVRFGDQNKTKFVINRGEMTPILEKAFFNKIKRSLNRSDIYEPILRKIAESNKEADVKQLKSEKRKQKNKISDKFFPPSTSPENLFIVEGGSALGSLIQKRNPKFDAVYALTGKIKNARKLSDLTSNGEIIDLMNILNLDPTNDTKCKYERIIISTDADPDGHHISSLLINLFHLWFPNVIRQGRLYVLKTPLISVKENSKIHYFYTNKEYTTFETSKNAVIRYHKGLGSLNKEDWEVIFDKMQLHKIVEDSRSDHMMKVAFGVNAGLRKKWLQS
jgi:topoisomerase-4 subunit B